MRRCSNRYGHARGFSLMELSVVLGIIALVAGAGMNMAAGALKAADRISTQEKLNTIRFTLDSFGKIYGYLPCPADPKLTPTTTNYGVENRNNYSSGTNCTSGGATGILSSSNVFIGALPVRTLGLPDSYASDAWGNKLTYAVSDSVTNDPASFSDFTNGSIIVKYKGSSNYQVTMNRRSTTYSGAESSGGVIRLTGVVSTSGMTASSTILHVAGTTIDGSYTAGTVTANSKVELAGTTFSGTDSGTIVWQDPTGGTAGYVVVSHGPDGLGAYPTDGTAVPTAKPCSGTSIDGNNCNNDSEFFDGDYNDGDVAAQFFDDYIIWGSAATYRTAANDTLYTSGTTSSCPTGTCEAWCAACTKNYAGVGATTTTIPPGTFTSGTAILCKKVLSSNATTCSASCFWGGVITSGTTYLKCP